MKRFDCSCGARVFFENTSCLSCGSELGFLPDVGRVSALTLDPFGEYVAAANPEQRYRKCQNYAQEGVCNWMVPVAEQNPLCQACRLNQVIPNLSDADNRDKWARVEAAKRRLVYSLNRLGLPLVPRSVDPEHGLGFDIKSDTPESRVLTGHADGLVTLNLAEADPVLREQMRLAMQERYRTLLGHFRHEIGHYYWDLLIAPSERLAAFRELFGDEQADYGEALKAHYANPPGVDTTGQFVSAYAKAHPWEDWAETWAHYLHMVDTLETAQSFGFSSGPRADAETSVLGAPFERLIEAWLQLTIALNGMNRSMGLPDAYPFQIGDGVKSKLAFVHETVLEQARQEKHEVTSQTSDPQAA
ncbi:MAG TPA: putative zinc-binding peptidase [Polyangiaceae bacterium]|nr:putative zinc-binding peptidase [Polyangiaceae bacterium]